MSTYSHEKIDKKWQDKWASQKTFKAEIDPKKPKYYALDMFPYPSAAGLHVGHLASYTPTDVFSRYKRAQGFSVLHPMGWDAFGLPAEQYAIQTGVHPEVTTKNAIETYKRQLTSFGFSFDWSREISTADPAFYKWTQFIFLKLYEKGLAYQKEVPVNWCPALRTVLANEEVVDGKSERGDHPVFRVPMKQWMLKITDYAERLLNDLNDVNWPERTKESQRNWIGKSEGAEIKFKTQSGHKFEVFTTRPDTLFGVSFIVLAPEHPLVTGLATSAQISEVSTYIAAALRKSEVDRKAATEKSGVFTGGYADHPLTGKPIPIWISDYVLMDYGSGAIMAVPGHDERDFEFATKYKLPILRVLEGGDLPFTGEGQLIHSEFLNGMSKTEAISRMLEEIKSRGFGRRLVQYKLRDWLFSRQRYWGEPFPMLRDLKTGELKPAPESELPVKLPQVADYQPSEKGEPPLARATEWVNYSNQYVRETDTMPGSAGSSWYFLRYADPLNSEQLISSEADQYWMPVDMYVGGPEHSVGHLLYARFWQKLLFDIGLTKHTEPFKRLIHQGMVSGADGFKMSKSRGNGVNPDEVREKYGADAVRMYICFLGPVEKDKPWATNGIDGVKRFLDRVWRLVVNDQGESIVSEAAASPEIEKLLHKTIKKVTEDIEALNYNTAISAMMILVNELYAKSEKPKEVLKTLTQLVAPFAPHFAEEVWEILKGQGFVSMAKWPIYDSKLVTDSTATVAIQVNGKMRGTLELSVDASESEAVKLALELASVQQSLAGQTPKKVIYKAGKIISLIV